MAQGTRGRWVRVAATGFGVLLCTGLVGCMNMDKDKKDKAVAKQPTPGLPGMQTLPGGSAASRPPLNTSGVQPAGGFGQQRTGMNTNTAGQPQPGFGNTNWPAQPGNPGAMGAPAQPGFVPSPLPGQGNFQPTGGTAAPNSWGSTNTNAVAPNNTVASASPLSPALTDIPLPPQPPPMPGYPTAPGGAVAVQPPTNSFAPIAPPAAPPGKGGW